jgi:TonB family protein
VRANRLQLLSVMLIVSSSFSTRLFAQAANAPSSPTLAAPAGASVAVSAVPAKLIKHIGGSVSAPVVISKAPILYTDAARKANISGAVVVHLQVDEQGNPSNVQLVRGLGLGLDENALRAVSQYKFKPAIEAGNPVAVEFNLQIDFKAAFEKTEPYESDSKFLAANAEGKKLTALGQLNFAIDAYKRPIKSPAANAPTVFSTLLNFKSGLAASRMLLGPPPS